MLIDISDEAIDDIMQQELLNTYQGLLEDLSYIEETGKTHAIFDLDPTVDAVEIQRLVSALEVVGNWYGAFDDLPSVQEEDVR